jgi:hypothetical protein
VLSFAYFFFDGFSGGEFPVSVRFRAGSAGMQFTDFADCGATSVTRYG